jgi:hypothetical protein
MEYDELEPLNGPSDWEEAFRQNPDDVAVALNDLLAARRDGYEPAGEHGRMYEAAEGAAGRMLAEEADEWLTIAHLDGEDE